MRAIISDIHGNLEALEAVLEDAQQQGATEIFCLGDLVGYGPDSLACVERAMSWPLVLMGNHDKAAMADEMLNCWSSGMGVQSIWYFQRTLEEAASKEEVSEFLRNRPVMFKENQVAYVHGTMRAPVKEYLFPEDIYHNRKMKTLAALWDGLCFCGHTHIPGVFHRFQESLGEASRGNPDSRFAGWEYLTPDDCNGQFEVHPGPVICNVGAVGQPRDDDPRASYVLFHDDQITFRRVEYDINRTAKKIYDIPALDDMLGDRLFSGK